MKKGVDSFKTKEKLTELLAKCAEKSRKEIDETMNPVQDLGMDSIKILDFILEIEDLFSIDFHDFSLMAQHMSTVSDLINFLCEFVDGRESCV